MAGKPGHGGKKGRSGRPKKPAAYWDEALAKIDKALPKLVETLIEKAEGGDREALIYLIDRLVGRPKQAIDNRMSFEWEVTPDERMQKLLEVEAEARLLLAPWREVNNQDSTNEQADNANESGT